MKIYLNFGYTVCEKEDYKQKCTILIAKIVNVR